MKIISFLKNFFSLDCRSLALFRILLGFTLLYDCLDRMQDFETFYSDDGIYSREFVIFSGIRWNPRWFSLWFISGYPIWSFFCFCCWILSSLGLTLGFFTNTNAFLCWFFSCSINSRFLFVSHAGDVLIRSCCFFSIFLPLGDHFSLDYLLKPAPQENNNNNNLNQKEIPTLKSKDSSNYQCFSIPAFALIVQILIMYLAAHYHKTGETWNITGQATRLSLQIDFLRKPFGNFLLNFPFLLKGMTFVVVFVQGWASFIYFIPFFHGQIRTVLIFLLFSFHFGLFLALRIDSFSIICCSAVCVLLPNFFWDNIIFNFFAFPKGIKLYYKKNCNLCFRFSKCIKMFYLHHSTDIISSDSNWFAVSYEGKYYKEKRGLLFLQKQLRFPILLYPILKFSQLFSPKFRQIHSFIHEKKNFKTREEFKIYWEKDDPNSPDLHQVLFLVMKSTFQLCINILCFLILLSIIGKNLQTLKMNDWSTPSLFPRISSDLMFDQCWNVFSPDPQSDLWWLSIQGVQSDGLNFDLFQNEGLYKWKDHALWPSQKAPENIFWKDYKNHRWFKFYENALIYHPNSTLFQAPYCKWICKKFKSKNQNILLKNLTVWVHTEYVNATDMSRYNFNQFNLTSFTCF